MRRATLDTPVLDALRHRLMEPARVALFIEEFTAEWNRGVAENSAARDATARDLASVERKLNGLINALAEGFRSPELQEQLNTLEARKADLQARLLGPAPSRPLLHPNLARLYQEKVEGLREALEAEGGNAAPLEAVRALIERIELTPAAGGKGFKIELVGEIAAMIRLAAGAIEGGSRPNGSGDPNLFQRSVKVVAGAGCH